MDGTSDGSCGSSCVYEFALPESLTGRFTLRELATRDLGTELSLVDGTTWEGTKSNYFQFSSSEISLSDSYACSEFGINYPNPAYKTTRMRNYEWAARARIGMKMDNTYPCYFSGEFHALSGNTKSIA